MKDPVRFMCVWMLALVLCSCNRNPKPATLPGAALEHACMAALTEVIVHDIFSPPVASRIYAYASLAYDAALQDGQPGSYSLASRMKGFKPLAAAAAAGEQIQHRLSAAWAFHQVSRALVFSKDSLAGLEQSIRGSFADLPADQFNKSLAWGDSIAAMILARASADRYRETRSMPRYSAFRKPGLWQQTPPDYSDAAEPHWKLIQPLRMDSAAACKPAAPPPYALDSNSQYYRELKEVYDMSKQVSATMDTIAHYWDDNPFVTEHKGHLTYANKKLTPVGHWMVITSILCQQEGLDEKTTARAYALTASAIFDGFISCWDEKYRSVTVRPITVIREQFQPDWNSLLQTPAFPEYTSGHSVISAAGSMVLRGIFGDGYTFRDTSEIPYLGLERRFPSIEAAAEEAGISRLYGGIHFRSAIDQGKEQGFRVAKLYLELVK
jgi:hypothetical protein